MGILDKAKDMLGGDNSETLGTVKSAVNEHEAQVDQGIDKAGDLLDGRTDGRFAGQVDKGQDFLKDRTGNL